VPRNVRTPAQQRSPLRFGLGLLAILSLLAPSQPAHAEAGDTLRLVRARGTLRCGVSEGIVGFSSRDAAGTWSGIDVDFCRAVAAVVLGDRNKVRFLPLRATARFPALASREIDILARNTTWSVEREATFAVIFVGVLYYDSQGFVARADSRFAHADTLDGARICVELGSNQLEDLRDFARRKGWRVTPLEAADFGIGRKDLQAGTCDVMTDDISALNEMLLRMPDPAAFVMRPERITKEPLGPAVRWDDGKWLALVRAVYAALLDADERGLTQVLAQAIGRAGGDATQSAYLAQTAGIARAFGIAPNWAALAVASAGNYAEMFARNLGADSRLKLEPGPNRPWNQGGLLYAPPFQ
jgi:general L-amino acid transport system substrate-binding protein